MSADLAPDPSGRATPDPRVWRTLGDPLVPGAPAGPLRGETVAVKDLYDVAGHPVGAGNPALLAGARPAERHAATVGRLLAAGAHVRGIAQTDELAYSLAGTNHHYGTPPNTAAPGRVPGGSTSGSAAAVALGEASIALGTDTGGSVRVPAAYQGLFGIRTTHGLVAREGLLPLAPSFDTVGWLTRDAALLDRVGQVLLPESPGGGGELVVVPELVGMAEPDVAAALTDRVADCGSGRYVFEHWPLEDLAAWREAFVVLQGWEAWQAHGLQLRAQLDVLGPDVRGRFERARTFTHEDADHARACVDEARARIRELVGSRILVLPSTPTVAPPLGPGLTARLQEVREATLALTCLAGIGGLPAVSLPLRTADGLPCGACLVAAPGRDRDLLALAVELTS